MSREISTPFSVGADGGIAWTDDPVLQALYHIESAITTDPGERVMRPNYGVRVHGMLFEPDDPSVEAGIVADMELKIHLFVPEVVINKIELRNFDPDDGQVEFFVSFNLVGSGSGETHEADILIGGTVIERTFPSG